MNAIKLNKAYKKAITDYFKAFEQMHDVKIEMVDDHNFQFGDIPLTFEELKHSVDNNLELNYTLNYFDYCLNYYDLSPIDFPNYCIMREGFMLISGFNFKEYNFIIDLLKLRIKSLLD